MDIGLNIVDNVRISMGDKLNDVTKSLDEAGIEYTIPYKYNSKSGESNVIVYIASYGVELALKNEIISYIKTTNSKLNYIMKIYNKSPVKVLSEIKENISFNFNVDTDKIRVDRFEAGSYNSIISIPYNELYKVRIILIMGANDSIFIESIQLVDI